MFQGCLTALVTPFRDGVVDTSALGTLVERQLDAGIDGLVPCGTTGEAPTLSADDFELVVRTVLDLAAGKVPVIVGTGTNSTAAAVERTRRARELGADGALVVTPHYNRPSQQGLYLHFRAVAEGARGLPIVLYNVPGRTGSKMAPETIRRLAELRGVAAIKEATGDLEHVSTIVDMCEDDFDVLSGDDLLTLPIIALGGKGVISTTSNVLPKAMGELVHAALDGDLATARDRHCHIGRLASALFMETNPIPVKTALAMMGLVEEEFRLPMCRMEPDNRDALKSVLSSYRLI